MMGSGVSAICRRCNKPGSADKFKLHYEYGQMVCPNCFAGKDVLKERNVETVKNVVKDEKVYPKGWDKTDDYLEKVEKPAVGAYTRVEGSDVIKYTCLKCSYKFKYDPFKRMPKGCPYCNEVVPRIKTYSLL